MHGAFWGAVSNCFQETINVVEALNLWFHAHAFRMGPKFGSFGLTLVTNERSWHLPVPSGALLTGGCFP